MKKTQIRLRADPYSVFGRLKAAYNVSNIEELATALGEPLGTVKGWSRRNSVPLDRLVSAALARGVSMDWLLGLTSDPPSSEHNQTAQTGGLVKSETEPQTYPKGSPSRPLMASEPPPPEMARIRRLSAKASAGPGHENHHVEPVADVAFNPAWLRARFGRSPEHLAIIEVTGHSMEPTFFEGDTIMVDTQQRDIEGGGLFVLRLGSELLVKRVQRLISGGLQIISDNPAFKSELLEPGFERQLEITGRVIWPRSR